MPFVCVGCLLLLLFNALGSVFWWRGPDAPNRPWLGSAAFCWGIFLLAVYLTWPVIRPLI